MTKLHSEIGARKNSAAEILRNKMLKTNIKRETDEATGETLEEIGGFEYLLNDVKSKMYNVLFEEAKYQQIGYKKPNVTLIYGISGVGKRFLVKCFARQYKVPILTQYFENALDVRMLFKKATALDRSIILIDKIGDFDEEKGILHQIRMSINDLESNTLVVFTHKDKNITIRYDNEIFVKIPSILDRKNLIDIMIRKVKTEGINTEELASLTPGFVPADVDKLIKMAITEAIALDASHVTREHFHSALKRWKNIQQIITFDDIGAMETVKEELKLSILLPSQFPDKFKKLGIHKPSGILLHGPPGCGKTLIAKAVSNMSHCNFLSIKGPELITKYVGDSEKHLRDLFEKAKNLSPCVLFFDEIDSLCGRRGTNEFSSRIVNQILTLLDGMEDRGEVYLIGATNRLDRIDAAMLRTGRFDKVIEVPLPRREEAIQIFEKCVSKIPIEPFDTQHLPLDGLSGADIAGVVKEAAVLCLKDNFDQEQIVITQKYFEMAIIKTRMMKNTEKTNILQDSSMTQ